jgi:ribosomal protein S18 acetylase RimI-like enzyme
LDHAPPPLPGPGRGTTTDVLAVGPHRVRVTPWLGHDDVATLVVLPGAPPVDVDDVRRWAEELRARGYRRALTAALVPRDQEAFLAAGFTLHEALHLLVHDLRSIPPAPQRVLLRRPHRADRPGVLAVDAAAFGDERRFDGAALDDAVAATPAARQRIATDDGGVVVAHAISGRGQQVGYLQRLAVAPSARRQGLGAALVVDALRWMRRHGASEALVNTQHGNEGALALYERLGFRRDPLELAVLRADLGAVAPPRGSRGGSRPRPGVGEDGA